MGNQRGTPPFKADHVGSLLRPKELLEARDRKQRGEITAAELREVEDAAIRKAVALQEEVGLQAVTDGEFRRTYFHIDFLEQLGGVAAAGATPATFRSEPSTLPTQDAQVIPPTGIVMRSLVLATISHLARLTCTFSVAYTWRSTKHRSGGDEHVAADKR